MHSDEVYLPAFLQHGSPVQLLLTYLLTVASLTISAAISLCLVHLYQPTSDLSDPVVEFLPAVWGFSPAVACLVIWLRYRWWWWSRGKAAAGLPLLRADSANPSPTSSVLNSQESQNIDDSYQESAGSDVRSYNRHHCTTAEMPASRHCSTNTLVNLLLIIYASLTRHGVPLSSSL